STWALMLTGRILRYEDQPQRNFRTVMHGLVRRSGEPMIRQAVRQAMRVMGRQFVLGRTIKEAVKNARSYEKRGYTYSYDMLGEAARTDADALRYFDDYKNAIEACGQASKDRGPIASPGVSVKLSALHARYELAQRERVLNELLPRMQELTYLAADYDINLTIDAEEAARLDLSLEIFDRLSADPKLAHWQGLGLAVQAYQKRAFDVIDWLATIAARDQRRIMTRLVKGAYWDTEIKLAQQEGLDGYPVFTRKVNTDVSFLACAKKLLADREHFYAQLATHNAHSLAWVRAVAEHDDFEFQRLHGMGEVLYEQALEGDDTIAPACRIYAPVGAHEDLLAYLVRRLLENGANSSFVNRIVDEKEPIENIVADPLAAAEANHPVWHPRIPLPADLYGARRPNSLGVDLSDVQQLDQLAAGMQQADEQTWRAAPLINGALQERDFEPVKSPANNDLTVGEVAWSTADDVQAALAAASAAAEGWSATPAAERAACLRRYAALLEQNMATLVAMCAREAGKHIPDSV